MFKRKGKKPEVKTGDGTTCFVVFEMMAHKDVGCPGCEGSHIGVGLHGCRPNLHNIPEDDWTAAEFLAYEAASEAADKMKFTGTSDRGTIQ